MTAMEKQLYDALKLLVVEVMMSGNGNARDFGWPRANRAAAEAIDAYEAARERESPSTPKTTEPAP